MNEKIIKLTKIYGKKPEQIIEELADQALRKGPPAGLGPRLMWIRGIQSMTRDELADAAGVSASSIGAYERGDQEPKASAIIALAGVLKVSTDFLLGLCNGKEAEP